jgi:hypothetical protein
LAVDVGTNRWPRENRVVRRERFTPSLDSASMLATCGQPHSCRSAVCGLERLGWLLPEKIESGLPPEHGIAKLTAICHNQGGDRI